MAQALILTSVPYLSPQNPEIRSQPSSPKGIGLTNWQLNHSQSSLTYCLLHCLYVYMLYGLWTLVRHFLKTSFRSGLGVNTQVYKFSSQVMPGMGLRKSPSLDTCHGPGWAISGDQWWSVKLWARGESLRTLKWWRAEGYLEWSEWPGGGLVISHGLTMENGECLRRMYHRLMMRTVYMYSVQSSWQNRLSVRWKCNQNAINEREEMKERMKIIESNESSKSIFNAPSALARDDETVSDYECYNEMPQSELNMGERYLIEEWGFRQLILNNLIVYFMSFICVVPVCVCDCPLSCLSRVYPGLVILLVGEFW